MLPRTLALALTLSSTVAFSPSGLAIRNAGRPARTTSPSNLEKPSSAALSASRAVHLAALERIAKPVFVPVIGYAGLAGTAIGAQHFVSAAGAGAATLMGVPLPLATLAAVTMPALVLLGEFAFLGGGERVAKMMGGQPADPTLTALCARVAERAGLPAPAHVYEIPTNELNAFAAGFGSGDATIAVTKGLRKALSTRQLEAVVAHELGHIRHADMRTNMHVAIAIAGLGGLYEMGHLLLRSERDSSDDEEGGGLASLGLALMVGGAAARVLAQLLQLSMSRGAEYDADQVAAELCGADAMIGALETIERGPANSAPRDRLAARGDAFAHAYIINGPSDARAAEAKGLRRLWVRTQRLFSTHPATHDRIEALRARDSQRS